MENQNLDDSVLKIMNSKGFTIDTVEINNLTTDLYTSDYIDEIPIGKYYSSKYTGFASIFNIENNTDISFIDDLIDLGFKLVIQKKILKAGIEYPYQQLFDLDGILVFVNYKKEQSSSISSLNFMSDGEDVEKTKNNSIENTIPRYITVSIYHKGGTSISHIIELAKKHTIVEKDKAKISLVVQTRHGLSTVPQTVKNTKIDIASNYGSQFIKVHEKIVDKLNEDKGKGLVLLHGIPGTGKTSYIRYLCKEIKKEVIFLPPFLAENIAGPDFIPFLLEHTNSILIIEDAEKVVLDRDTDRSNRQSVANLLNITDGILSDCLSIQIVATFNTSRDRIDKALLRKGRLIAEWKFDALDVDHSNALIKELKRDYITNKPMTLTEIYNLEEELHVVQKEVNKIGFYANK